MVKPLLAMSVMIALYGCTDSGVKDADGKILCDPESGEAYIVEHRVAAVSKIVPVPHADQLCKPR